MNEVYCPTCKKTYLTFASNPPYAVIHISKTEHLNAVSREPITKEKS